MNNRRVFLFRDAPTLFASAGALLKSVCGARSARLLAWLSDDPTGPKVSVDIGRFARVVTSDPTRIDGASSARREEYQTKDLFLETSLPPTADGSYVLPATEGGMGSIGLVWYERRPINTLELQFADPARMPAVDGVRVEAWVGTPRTDSWPLDNISETLWQESWVR